MTLKSAKKNPKRLKKTHRAKDDKIDQFTICRKNRDKNVPRTYQERTRYHMGAYWEQYKNKTETNREKIGTEKWTFSVNLNLRGQDQLGQDILNVILFRRTH